MENVEISNKIQYIIKNVNKKREEEIVRAIRKWALQDEECMEIALINEEKLKEVIILGMKEYRKIYGKDAYIGSIY